MSCLTSWCPHKQALWVYSTLETLIVPGVAQFDLSEILPQGVASFLLAHNTPPQMVKDVMQFRILHKFGGVFTDLDVLWVGRPLPAFEGDLFVWEATRDPSRRFSRRTPLLSLAICGFAQGSILARDLADKCLTRWQTHAEHVREGKLPVQWQKCSPQWMANTRDLTEAVVSAGLQAAIRMPIELQPYPLWLKDLESASCLELPPWGEVLAYQPPHEELVRRHSICVNLWERQWSQTLQRQVLALATDIRELNLQPVPNSAQSAEEARALCKCSLDTLAGVLPEGCAYKVVGGALLILDKLWCHAFLAPVRESYSVKEWAGAALAMSIVLEGSLDGKACSSDLLDDSAQLPEPRTAAEHLALRTGGARPEATRRCLFLLINAMGARQAG